MRKTTGLLLIAGCLATASSVSAGEEFYKVELNKTEIVRLPSAASSIIVGNPKIADVTVQSADTLLVVGRGYGETNLIIFDADGKTMMDTNLQVVNTLSPHAVRLYNAKRRETYSCIPYCGPSPVLGDDPEFIGGNTSQERALDGNVAGPGTSQQDQSSGNNGDTDFAGSAPFPQASSEPY